MNYSYITGTSRINGGAESSILPDVAHHLAKEYYIYDLNNALSLSEVVKYVGSKDREPGDTRNPVAAYMTMDLALQYKNLGDNYSVTFGIKNIFDATVTYPSPPNTYIEDYRQESRTFLITFTKKL